MQPLTILGSLQIAATAAPAATVLLNTLMGKTVEATLEAVLPEGLLLRLADGKLLQTQGTLPFPEGMGATDQPVIPSPSGEV